MKKIAKILVFTPLLLCCGLLSYAREYDKAIHSNLWYSSRNTAGIRMDSITVSTARLSGTYESGGFRDIHMAESSWSAGAEARTITHLERFSMNGTFSFENFSGNGMTGSMSSRPGYYPVDMLEFTPGRKTMQTYHIQGGISIDLNDVFILGAGLDYTSRNYTKRKDLRHTTWLMDLTAGLGLIAKIGDETSLGLSYLYNKSSEKIKAEELGISSTSYYAFHDKGMMFGVHDIWTGGGVHLKKGGVDGFPTAEQRHGIGLQLAGKGLFAELAYIYGIGHSGEKDVRWYRFPSHEAELTAGYKFMKGGVGHFLHLDASFKSLSNHENVIVEETAGGITNNITYGSNMIFAQKTFRAGAGYEAVAERWAVWGHVSVENAGSLSSVVYPYVYEDAVFAGKAGAGAMVRIHKVDLKAELLYSQGFWKIGSRNADEGIHIDKVPQQLEGWYNMSMDYRTVPQIHPGLSVRYNFLRGMYIEAEGRFIKAFNPEYIDGDGRLAGMFAFGYTF